MVLPHSSRFSDSYYTYNALLVLAYIPLRQYFRLVTPDGSDYSTLHSVHAFATWEKQVLFSFCIIVAYQFTRRRSWDHLAQNVFFYGKLITALTAYQVDTRLLVWYALLCWVASVVCPQPFFQLFGKDTTEVIYLDPPRMKDMVLRGADMSWLVFYYSEQHKDSKAMAPAFYELAKRYSSSKLRFGCMDATLWPDHCKDSLRVTPNTWTAHLPCVVLYSKGKEVGRLPRPEDIDELGLKRNHYKKADVVKKLNLDKIK